MHQINIRDATVEDVETLFDIRCSVRENHMSREALAELDITPASVAEMINSGNYISPVAEIEGYPIAFAMAEIPQSYVFAVFVRPSHEGMGAGRLVLEAVERGLAASGVEEAWLSTGSEPGLRSPGFYRHLNWKHSGFLDDGQIRFVKRLH